MASPLALRFEDFQLTYRARRRTVPVLRRAEHTTQVVLRRRFARQAQVTMGVLLTMLPGLIERHGADPPTSRVAAADPPPVPRDVNRVVELAFDASVTYDEMLRVRSAQARAAQSATQATVAEVGAELTAVQFQLVARQSVRWLNRHTNALFRSVDATTKRRIGQSLARGLEAGEHLDALTARVQRTLGEGGWRARMIAQTETINAYSRASEETASELGVAQMQWLDGQAGACPICVDLHEVVKEVGGEYVGTQYTRTAPPAHPACRCAQIPYEEDD